MKAKISFDVMTNNGSTHYGEIRKEVELPVEWIEGEPNAVIDGDMIRELVLEKFPTLLHVNYKIALNYIHYPLKNN